VVGGSADVVSGAYEHTINLQSKAQMFQAFVLQGRAPQIAFGVSRSKMPNYKGLSDLRGAKIGVSAPGSSTNMVANYVIAKGGLKPADVSFVGVGTGNGAIAALRSGQIDAISNVDPVMTMLGAEEGEVTIISRHAHLEGHRTAVRRPDAGRQPVCPEDFVQKAPQHRARRWPPPWSRRCNWIQAAGPSDIIKTVPEAYLLGDRALYLASFNAVRDAISPDGLITEAGAKTRWARWPASTSASSRPRST
jgi:NitT/TauT family transport system substrate-binding protein